MSLYASIDLGSNTVRLLVARKKETGLDIIFSDHKITRLGENLHNTGILIPEAMDRTISAIKHLKDAAEQYDPDNIWIAATSAVRESKNKNFFVERVKAETDLDIEVIPWEEEGRRMLIGVYYGLGRKIERGLIVDIGGGSAEFVFSKGKRQQRSTGNDLGAVRLAEHYLKNDPIDDREFREMEKEIEQKILKAKSDIDVKSDVRFIGVGGTVTTIAALDLNLFPYNPERVNGHAVKIERVNDLIEELKNMSLYERESLHSLEKGREDLIVPGMAVVKKIMEIFELKEMTVSEWGLREGILLDHLELEAV